MISKKKLDWWLEESSRSSPVAMGTVASDATPGVNLSNYVQSTGATNPATFTASGNDIVLNRSTTSDYNSYITYLPYGSTSFEYYTLVFEFTLGAITSTSTGAAFGIQSTSSFGNRSLFCQFNNSSGANGGKSFILTGSTTTPFGTVLQTSSVLTRSAGDRIRMMITRSDLTTTCLTQNLTQGGSTTITQTFSLVPIQTNNQHNTGRIAVYSVGGVINLNSWTYTTTQKKNIDYCFVGDSIFYGAFAGSLAARFASVIKNQSTKTIEVNSGSGDYTQQWLWKIAELKAMNAANYILCTANDLRFSVSASVYKANWTSVRNSLANADSSIGKQSSNIIHMVPVADSAVDVSVYQTWLATAFPLDQVIDLYALTKNAGNTTLSATYDSGDGTHPNSTGHTVIANKIIADKPTIL
jgi:lysophospholipase L1-like esterase